MIRNPPPGAYDPNRLFDTMLRRLNLEDDEALAQMLSVGRRLLFRIRRGEIKVGAALLIRIHEKSGIRMEELRQMLGDRRTQFRLDDTQPGPEAPDKEGALPTRESRVRNDAGLPNTVQWT